MPPLTIESAREIVQRIRSTLEYMRDADQIILARGFIACWESEVQALKDRLEKEKQYSKDVAEANLKLSDANDALQKQVGELRGALEKIASWGEGETVDGSFDEPESAKEARKVLLGLEKN